jgi:hypothetical protein
MLGESAAGLNWRTSSFCAPSHCVQVAIGTDVVYVRSSRDQSRDPLKFDFAEWSAFVAGVRNNEFDVSAPDEVDAARHVAGERLERRAVVDHA